jgi:hypothetical protein
VNLLIGNVAKKSTKEVIEQLKFNGALGDNNSFINQAAEKLTKYDEYKDEFKFDGETKYQMFINNTESFAKGGFAAGAALANMFMAPYDLLVGKGDIHEKPNIIQKVQDDGLLGCALEGASVLTGSIGEVIGGGLGAVSGALSVGTLHSGNDKLSIQHSAIGGALTGMHIGGKSLSYITGCGSAIALNAFRIPSIVIKYSISGIMGFAGSVIGAGMGAMKYLINK